MDRSQIDARIAELKKERGIAVMNGRRPDKWNAEITVLELERDVLDDVAAAEINRDRDAAEADRLKRRQDLVAEYAGHRASYLDDTREDEAHMRASAALKARRLKTA